MKNNKDFFLLFYKREMLPLLGKNKSNLLILALMLFTTFSVIGFAEGSLRYLETKMKDPFINWVDIIPAGLTGMGVENLLFELNTEEVEEAYGLKTAVGYNRFQINFYYYDDIVDYYRTGSLDTNRIEGVPARTIDTSDPVIHEVFSGKNLLFGEGFSDSLDIGLIITENTRKQLNYPERTPYIWMDMQVFLSHSGSRPIRLAIPVPVKGIVRSLPGLAGFASTPYFFQQRTVRVGDNPFNPADENRLLMAFNGSSEEVFALEQQLQQFFQEFEDSMPYQADRVWSEPQGTIASTDVHHVFVTFRPRNIPLPELNRLFRQVYNSRDMDKYRSRIIRMYDYNRKLTAYRAYDDYDRISLNFSSLDKLREFSLMLYNTRQIEVDMAQIESRENYNFVTRLTGIISVVLIVFSIISVLLFVGHLLKKHLESIRRNIGTFKAFGLSDKLLINIYIRIVLSIMGLAAIIALAISAIFGYLGGMRMILVLFGSHYEKGRYFNLDSIYLLVALVMLVVFSIIVLRMITYRIFNQTPGDLIYER